MTALDRRQFLTAAVGTSVGIAASSIARPAAAIEPVRRGLPSKYKFSLAAYSYRELLASKPEPKLTVEDFIRDCAKFGLEGTELTSYYFPKEPSDQYFHDLRRLAFQLGLDISGTAIANDFCFSPGEERDKQLQHVKTWVDRAATLDAPVIRVFSGNTKKDQSPEDSHRLAVQGLEECCEYAGKHGVMLALENHGGLTTKADEMLTIVRDVKSPWFGVNLDTGNFRSDDVYGDLAKLAPYAVNVQIKVVVANSAGMKEPADFGKLAKIMNDVGYRGYIVLEFEEKEDPREACPKYLDQLRTAFGRA